VFTLFAFRIALGRLFQSFGAAHVNERSPRVVRLLNTGYFNKSVSDLVLRLYLPGFFSSMSSDRYRGARPSRVKQSLNSAFVGYEDFQISEGVIHRGRRPRWITLSSTRRILHILLSLIQ